MAHRRGKTIDFKQWQALPGLVTTVAAAQTFLGSGALNFLQPGTILRVHCPNLLVMFDATKQVGDEISVSMGLGVFATDAVAAGAASMPDPANEPEFPWMMWDQFALKAELAAGEEALGSSVIRRSYDIKSMRKIRPGQTLTWVVQTGTVTGAPQTLYHMNTNRVLFGT